MIKKHRSCNTHRWTTNEHQRSGHENQWNLNTKIWIAIETHETAMHVDDSAIKNTETAIKDKSMKQHWQSVK